MQADGALFAALNLLDFGDGGDGDGAHVPEAEADRPSLTQFIDLLGS